MPIMYEENTLQMEWCLECHRDPAKNLRPTSEIYNMAWTEPSGEKPVWCGVNGKAGVPTAQMVNCTVKDPGGVKDAAYEPAQASVSYTKFTNQRQLGLFLTQQYHIRPPNELTSCETCHR